jgi:N-acetylmuramoyl-L-alanine amidase
VYFNFPNSRLSAGFARDLAVKGGALTRIRASQFNDNTSRLVLDLNPVDKLKVTTRRQGPKLIIALSDIELSREPALETPPPAQALAAPRMAQALQGAPKPAPAAEPEQVTALLDALVPQSPSASVEEGPRPAADDSVLAMLNALSHSGSTAKKTASKAVEKTAGKVVEEVIETPVRTPREASVPKAEKESARAAKPVATKPRALLAKPKRARPPEARAEVAAKVTTIVVDPGHGGKDYGAKGRHGLYEKEVNLKVSKLIKKILETRYNYRVVLTRDDDTFIPLDKRGDVANEKGADLFVSVHANAAKRRSAHGIETYYLGTGHSAQAQETAARENGELVKSVKDDQVQQILASLISTTKINDSAMLAGHVQDELYKNIKKIQPKVRDLGVKEGPFFVLHDTNMPSILVEVGFVTHRREERSLKDPKYLNQLARAIAKGIHGFLNDRGPTI